MLDRLGKPRTKLGLWLDKRGIKQEWLIKHTKLGRNTITWACGDHEYMPTSRTMQKILDAIRTVDPTAKVSDFWDI